jgi:mono/diheme cytochrome c family protein
MSLYFMKHIYLIALIVLTACTASESDTKDKSTGLTVASIDLTASKDTGRWYSTAHVNEGRTIFAQYCASCHGKNAESVDTWRTPDSNGNFPPPPLNGSAHAWHHPLNVMNTVIRDGGAPLGGVMPAWGSVLSEDQRLKAVASFQAYWSDEIYAMWLEREQFSREN